MRLRGGLAFSPGDLSAQERPDRSPPGSASFTSHADFEQDCSRCHQPLAASQDTLCLACHDTVASQAQAQTGLHAHLEARCAACHPDHRGRGFDIAAAALPYFDHTTTHFSLVWHQVGYDASPLTCEACHLAGQGEQTGYAFNLEACVRCHATHSPEFMLQHNADFGLDCLACHDGLDTLALFDHQHSDFPLEGQHADLACAECHRPNADPQVGSQRVLARFAGLSTACQDCHTEPEQHRGLFGVDCQTCHTTTAWKPAQLQGQPFDHETMAAFSLARHAQDYAGQPLSCAACHRGGTKLTDSSTCVECHQAHDAPFMQAHVAQAGPTCLECHDGRDRMSGFDHAMAFQLTGRHAGLACRECHLEGRFEGTTSLCVQCHAEPAIHAGFFGLECQRCHGDAAWSPAYLQEHTFPLDHGERGPVECKVCHPSTFTEYTCYGCHEHQPDRIANEHREEGISQQEMVNCVQCHPSGQEEEDD